MDGLSGAASIIAVVQITASIASALKDYYEGVRDARSDIQQLYHSIRTLRAVVSAIPNLDIQHKGLLTFSASLTDSDGPLKLLLVELRSLEAKLGKKIGQGTIGKTTEKVPKLKVWFGALKWPFEKGDVTRIVDIVEKHKATLVLQFGVENLAANLKIFDVLEDIKSDIRAASDDQERRQVVEWLSNGIPDPSEEHNIARDKHEPNTGSWLLDGTALAEWISSENSMLWLNGGAGAGKSILCSTVIEHIQAECSGNPRAVLAYWYFTFANTEKQSVSNLLCSLIKDICSNRRDTPPELKIAFDDANRGQHRPTTKRLMELLKAVLMGFDSVFIIIDAVDECPKSDGKRAKFLETIREVVSWQVNELHVFVTSRRELDIVDTFKTLPSQVSFQAIEAQGIQCRQDIESFLKNRLGHAKFSKWRSELKVEVEHELAWRADGMFRLAALQLDALAKCRNEGSIRAEMQGLPKTLDEFYERTLFEIEEDDRQRALRALQALACAVRDLSVNELAEIMIINSSAPPYIHESERFMDNNVVLEILPAGLITTQPYWEHSVWAQNGYSYRGRDRMAKKTTVRLAHFSVLEYLSSARTMASPASVFHINEYVSHQSMVEICIACLTCVGESGRAISAGLYDAFPLLHYAAVCWIAHLRALGGDVPCDNLQKLLISFLQKKSNAWNVWIHFGASIAHDQSGLGRDVLSYENLHQSKLTDRMLEQQLGTLSRIQPLALVPMLGVDYLLANLLTGASDLNQFSDNGLLGTPLYAASCFEKVATMKAFLAAGADINIVGGALGTSLHAASWTGNVEAIQMLFDSGSDINSMDGPWGSPLTTAMQRMVTYEELQSPSDIKIVSLFIENGATLNVSPSERLTDGKEWYHPLISAVLLNRSDFVSLLLENGANIEAADPWYGTSLQTAAQFDREEIFGLLLDNGADISVQSPDHGGILDFVSEFRSIGILRQLLEREFESTLIRSLVTDPKNNLLEQAVSDIKEGHVKMLLEAGAGARSQSTGRWEKMYDQLEANIRALETALQAPNPLSEEKGMVSNGDSETEPPPEEVLRLDARRGCLRRSRIILRLLDTWNFKTISKESDVEISRALKEIFLSDKLSSNRRIRRLGLDL